MINNVEFNVLCVTHIISFGLGVLITNWIKNMSYEKHDTVCENDEVKKC